MNAKASISLRAFFDEKVNQYNQRSFIASDPVCIPHLFTRQADIEIAGLFAAVFAWGNRTTIINKSKELMGLMDHAPHDFCMGHSVTDLKRLEGFKHRTFTTTDLLYFIEFFQYHYSHHSSLEEAFLKKSPGLLNENAVIGAAQTGVGVVVQQLLTQFHNYFFSLEHIPSRTKKHISTPHKGSTCKRLNMYLRWMVRSDENGVDFGIWKKISPAQLVCPIDVHVARVAARFGILKRKQIDWQAAVELTHYLRILDPLDPVKYDFALFGLGVIEKY